MMRVRFPSPAPHSRSPQMNDDPSPWGTKDPAVKRSQTTSREFMKGQKSRCRVCGELSGRPFGGSGKHCQDHKPLACKDIPFEGLKQDGTRKRRLIKERGNHCEVCFIPGFWNGKELKLEIDHIDGNSDENRKENLRLICPNCHSQTSTYKSRNRRKGTQRSTVRARYYRNASVVSTGQDTRPVPEI